VLHLQAGRLKGSFQAAPQPKAMVLDGSGMLVATLSDSDSAPEDAASGAGAGGAPRAARACGRVAVWCGRSGRLLAGPLPPPLPLY